MLVDRGGLWYKVLVVRYGEEDGGRSGSSWWKEVVKIRDGTVGAMMGGLRVVWVMMQILCFGMIGGVVTFLSGCALAGYLI